MYHHISNTFLYGLGYQKGILKNSFSILHKTYKSMCIWLFSKIASSVIWSFHLLCGFINVLIVCIIRTNKLVRFSEQICGSRKLEDNCFLSDNHGLLELLCFISLRLMRTMSNCLSSHERFINISGWDALATSKTQWCIMSYNTRHKHQRLRKSHPKYYESASWLRVLRRCANQKSKTKNNSNS